MEKFDYLIVGGGPAGVTAAETIRTEDPSGSIAIVSDEAHALYSRVLLPNYVKGLISRERVFLRDRADYERLRIQFFGGEHVTSLDREAKTIRTRSGIEFGFGKLLAAGGGKPKKYALSGSDLLGVFRFQTIEDADAIRAALVHARHVAVAGDGFIALEFLGAAHAAKVPATACLMNGHFFPRRMDAEGGAIIRTALEHAGIEIFEGDPMEEIIGEGAVKGVRARSGRMVDADFVGLGIGLSRDVAWLGDTPTWQGARLNGVLVDECMQIWPDIFAAGDVAMISRAGARPEGSGNWVGAVMQGRTAGWNMAHSEVKQAHTRPSVYAISSFGLAISFIGEAGEGEGIMSVARRELSPVRYARFFLQDGVIRGAVTINMPQIQGVVASHIERKIVVKDPSCLADLGFDLHNL